MIEFNSVSLDFVQSEMSEIWNQEITFNLRDFYHVYAVSGSGKTSFLKLLTRELTPSKGSIDLDGKNYLNYSLAQIRKTCFSVVFQDLKLIQGITVIENLMLRADLFSIPKSEVKEMLEFLDIDYLMNKTTSKLSRGEQQRVAIIRALIGEFKFLLLDEAFSHLDEVSRSKAVSLILKHQKEKEFGLIHCNVSDDNYFNYSACIKL